MAAKKVKVTLNCVYGKGQPGETVAVDEKVAESLVGTGSAKYADESAKEVDLDAKKLASQNAALAARIDELEKENAALAEENKGLNEAIQALETK